MAERNLLAMRRVAAVRAAQRMLAQRAFARAADAVAAADAAWTGAGQRVDTAFAAWRAQADADGFQPEIERWHAAQLIERSDEAAAARAERDRAAETLSGARQGLRHADAALDRSAMVVRRLARRERLRREERQLGAQEDRVTQRWRGE